MRYPECVVCYESVGWIGLTSNLALAFMKMFVGLISGSHALVADSLYSAKDVIASVLIIIGLKVSKKPIDKEHPYGHGKIEFILSGVVSVIFIGATGLIFLYAAESLLEGKHEAPLLIALWAAIFSVLANALMYTYTKCVSREINSPMVNSLSKHHSADALSSMAVAVGIICSHYLGMPWLDSFVALFESVHLLYLGGEILWDSYQGLMDSSAPKEVIERIEEETSRVKGVSSIEQLRTRLVGQDLWIDMIVGVDPDQSISDAKKTSDLVEETIAKLIDHVGNISVHFKSPHGSVPELEAVKSEMKLKDNRQDLRKSGETA